jgi:hypothetical protein
MKLIENIQAYRSQRREERQLAAALEQERQERILAGKIPSIILEAVRLNEGEKAYFHAVASRLADVEHTVTMSSGKSKRKGVISRGLVGGLIAGPIGIVAGAATASKHHNMRSTDHTFTKNEVIDKGILLFTNQRILFLGKQMTSIPYDEIVKMEVQRNNVTFHYVAMQPGEAYRLSREMTKEADLYYRGITSVVANRLTSNTNA